MGQCLGSGPADVGMEEEDDDDKKKEKRKDNRKRNSQLFSLVDFIDATKNRTLKPGEEEIPELDYTQIICTNASGKKARETDWTKMDPRAARANKTAGACGFRFVAVHLETLTYSLLLLFPPVLTPQNY